MIISGNGATALVKIESRDPQRKQIYTLVVAMVKMHY